MPFSVPERTPTGDEHSAVTPRVEAPGRETPGTPGSRQRPSQVPVPGETAGLIRPPFSHSGVGHARQSRPSGALANAASVPARASAVSARLVRDALHEPAQPLAASVKREMETRLGTDFSSVRVHTGGTAHASAVQIGAQAYTVGDHVVVGDRGADRHTLAHELTHVIQQRQGPVAGTSRGDGLKVSDQSDAFERAAEANAARAMRAPLGEHRQAPAETGEGVAVGNAASGGHVRSRGAGDRAAVTTVQRKVGFEAELSVPTMPVPPRSVPTAKNPDGREPTRTVEGFLRGGLLYGAYLGHNEHFTLKPDHNELQDEHLAIRKQLKSMAFVLPKIKNSMSNLEYVTPARDELAPHSNKKFKADIKAITDHSQQFFPKARSTEFAISVPANNSWTGIPLDELKAWLGPRYSKVKSQVDAYIADIKESFYLQATVGIIPSALPDLYKSRVPANNATNLKAHEIIAKAVHKTVNNLINQSDFKDNSFVADLQKNHPIDYEALVGLLYLTFSYKLGSALNQTTLFANSSEKSTVAFMSKMKSLTDVINKAAPTELRKRKVPEDLIMSIDVEFDSSDYVDPGWWARHYPSIKIAEGRKETITSPWTFVSEVLSGKGPAAIEAATHESRTFPEPDPVPKAVSAASGDQRGAQVEYRYITARPDAAGLADELMKVVKEARELNTRHLDPLQKKSIIDTAEM